MASVSGLALAGQDALMLHQPHQARDFDAPGDKFIRVLNFDSPTFGKNNTVQLEALEMVVDEIWVEFQLSQLSATQSNAKGEYVPVPTMISDNGCQLFYNGQSVYTISEAEALIYPFANCENEMQLLRRLDAGVVYPRRPDGTAWSLAETPATTRNEEDDPALYYMDLRPFLKILKHAGPLNAYAPNKWKISVGLLASTQVGQSNFDSGGSASVVTGMAIANTNMRLILSGHREDAQNTQRISQSLATDGIKLSFTQSNHFRYDMANTSTNFPFSLTSLEGEATDIWIMGRGTTRLTSTTATGQLVDHMQFPAWDSFDQLLAIGTQSNPTRVNGLYLPIKTMKLLQQGTAYNGGPMWLTQPARTTNGALVDLTLHKLAVVMAPLAEAASDGQLYGTYSGSIRLKNDFVINFQMGTAHGISGGLTIDIIVYIRRNMVITHLGIVMMNE